MPKNNANNLEDRYSYSIICRRVQALYGSVDFLHTTFKVTPNIGVDGDSFIFVGVTKTNISSEELHMAILNWIKIYCASLPEDMSDRDFDTHQEVFMGAKEYLPDLTQTCLAGKTNG